MKASEFHQIFGVDADFWSQDSKFPLEDWQYEVQNDDTRLGYWDWVIIQHEITDSEEEE